MDSPAVRRAAEVLDERHPAAAEDWAELSLSGGPEEDLQSESTSALGVLRQRQGRVAEAIELHRAGLDIADRLPDRRLAAHLRIEFSDTLLDAGDRDRAAEMFGEAVELARTAQARLEEARGLTGLAAAMAGTDPAAAGRHRARAEAMYREMNLPSSVHASV